MHKLLFASALSLLAASSTLAATAPQIRSVSYRDLDLSRPEGRATLDRRVENAIRDVCNASVRFAGLFDYAESRRCMRRARAEAGRSVQLAIMRARRAAGQVDLARR
ncbi:MAG: UrcA family protein [Sphingomonadaceae bacterium]|nr:UrcA family protein [Sphingomonadaceae bacterium]